MTKRLFVFAVVLHLALGAPLAAAGRPRARDLGVPFDGTPGPLDAITDVKGVAVGHSTIIRGEGKLEVGKGPVRTGVTAVVPRGKETANDPVFAGWWALNGAGEMTGTTWVEESGFLEGPVQEPDRPNPGCLVGSAIKPDGAAHLGEAQFRIEIKCGRCRGNIYAPPHQANRRRRKRNVQGALALIGESAGARP